MSIRKLLKEISNTDFVTKYKNDYSSAYLNSIMKYVKPEYWEWVVNKLTDNNNEGLSLVISYLNKFDKLKGKLQTTDINKLGSIEDLVNLIKTYNNQFLKNKTNDVDGNILYEDDNLLIVNPLTYEKACYYDSNGIGCNSMGSYTFDRTYGPRTSKKIINIIDKNNPENKLTVIFDGLNTPQFYRGFQRIYDEQSLIDQIPNFETVYSFIIQYLEDEFSGYYKNFDFHQVKKDVDKKEMEKRIALENKVKMDEANERRVNDEWELGPDCPTIGLKAHALFDHLSSSGEIEVLDEEGQQRKRDLLNRKVELEDEYDSSDQVREDLLAQIDQIEDELSEFDDYMDVYDMIPDGERYGVQRFEVGDSGEEYTVGDSDEMDDALREYVEDMVKTEGYDHFSSWVKEQAIDEDQIIDWFQNYYDDVVYQEPEHYLDESQRQLDSQQVEKIKIIEARTIQTEEEILRLGRIMDEIEDDDKIEKIESRIEQLREYISELDDLKEEIEDNPEGDFDDADIEVAIEERMDDVRDNPISHAEDYGLEMDGFVDEDKFIETVIENDGYELMSHNDGDVNEEAVEGTIYYIIKL
jgi:hypothetical protein